MHVIFYQPDTDHDLLVAHWWGHLRDSGDLAKLLAHDEQPFSRFMRDMRKPTELVFQLNPDNPTQIVRAAYFQPFTLGALVGLWLHESVRRTRDSLAFVEEVLTQGLRTWPLLVNFTKQPSLLDVHRKLGYTISEEIPAAWDGQSAWIMTLTRRSFEEAQHGRQQSRTTERIEGAGSEESSAVRHLEPDATIDGGAGEPAPPDRGCEPTHPAPDHPDELRPKRILTLTTIPQRQPRSKSPRRYAVRPTSQSGSDDGGRATSPIDYP